MASDTTIRNATGASARQSRIYWRNQGGKLRAYADLRDRGGGQVALIPEGEKRAATDPAIAEELLRQRLNDLAEKRRSRVLLGTDPDAELASYAIRHLQLKAESGEYSDRWLAISKKHLDRAVAFFTRYQHACDAEPDPEPRPRNLAAISATEPFPCILSSRRSFIRMCSACVGDPVLCLLGEPADHSVRGSGRWTGLEYCAP